jgi:hypothetical protein
MDLPDLAQVLNADEAHAQTLRPVCADVRDDLPWPLKQAVASLQSTFLRDLLLGSHQLALRDDRQGFAQVRVTGAFANV